MDIMLILQIIVLLGAIFLGVRLGGIGIGYAGGAGVLVLGLILGMKPGNIPWDVILIIASVIAAISAMQLAGGLDYLVQIAERILRSNPKYINYLAPVVTYVLTFFAGTGHTAFSMLRNRRFVPAARSRSPSWLRRSPLPLLRFPQP